MEMSFSELESMCVRLIKENPALRVEKWHPISLAIWLREGCRCAYCGRDMLSDRDFARHYYEHDHVLPVKNYPQFEHAESYRVLACRACNSLKSTWDPNKDSQGDPPILAGDAKEISPEQLRELVNRTKKHLRKTRFTYECAFSSEKAVILDALAAIRLGTNLAAAMSSGT